MNLIQVIIDGMNLAFYSLALLISIAVLILIFICIHPLKSNVAIILTCNTYISLCLNTGMMVIMYAYNFYGDLKPSLSFEDNWCQLRAYLAYSGYTAFYYSCVLQATFRLFRVIFYRKKFLQSTQFFSIAIIIQWILSFIIPLTNYLSHDYEYIPFQNRCWISFENIRGLMLALLLIYSIPLFTIIFIYFYIIRYVRRTTEIQQRRRKANERDLLILKRIVSFLLIIISIGIPTVVILFIYIVSRYMAPMSYQIQGLSLAIPSVITGICCAFITPQIQDLFKRNHRQVFPLATIRNIQNNMTQSI